MTFDEWFKDFTSWNLTRNELLACSFKPGENSDSDVVYVSPDGHMMTRYVCNNWLRFYGSAKCGWDAAVKHVVKLTED